MNTTQDYAPIGVFDSGKGGLYTMRKIQNLLPEYDYLFYGDSAHMPYGERAPEDVKLLTFAGIQWLFSHGCQIVIVACNTAAAYAVRDRQTLHPDQKVLSVTIPGVEALVESGVDSSLVLCTTGTRESGIIPELAIKNNYQGSLTIKQLPGLADIIEQEDQLNTLSSTGRIKILKKFIGSKAQDTESVLLACTHYGVWYEEFQQLFPDKKILDPTQEAAHKLVNYLERHPEIESKLTRGARVTKHWTKK